MQNIFIKKIIKQKAFQTLISNQKIFFWINLLKLWGVEFLIITF